MQSRSVRTLQAELHGSSGAKSGAIRMTAFFTTPCLSVKDAWLALPPTMRTVMKDKELLPSKGRSVCAAGFIQFRATKLHSHRYPQSTRQIL